MLSLPTLASLLLLAVPRTVYADPCVAFDIDFNLLAFGFGGKDFNAGPQDSWTSGDATDITASGRPPFDGVGTTCYLAQFFNAVYVLNGDKANPSDVHIYDATKKSWSTQKVTAGTFDTSSFKAILDHDTNVFYAISHGEMWSLDLGEQTVAKSDALSWTDVQTTPYGSDYDPTMALAQNHIHFIGVPDVPAGSVDIFVIHFSFFQPQPQSYSGASAFPATHGQTASFFQSEGVQQEFAFIPDDGSMTYVINVENNSTSTLAGPTSKDPKAQYAASITALVQLDSTGAVSFIPYKQGDASTNSAAKWATVAKIAAVAPAGTSASGTGSGASATGASGVGTAPAGTRLPASGTATGSASSQTGGAAAGSNGAFANAASFGSLASALLAALAFLQ
ncbi:hypothetical protein K466DRAFT_638163 [Polyporus arcularius HHB13444]|uniref:Uncharacterized protein n=1 Tax=Polyporus arcularius HHB13444 TaxID=1314778 RepID=A0A5C3PPV3_9APHY|nr:hypothetical protein K466DRAFT_638163 [Polyporus arcularius HHB13444]